MLQLGTTTIGMSKVTPFSYSGRPCTTYWGLVAPLLRNAATGCPTLARGHFPADGRLEKVR